MEGTGVNKDYGKAVKWLKQAVDHEDIYAKFSLGQCYENDWGAAQDKDEAMRLYKEAAAQGIEDAQKRLDELAHPAPSGGAGFVDKIQRAL